MTSPATIGMQHASAQGHSSCTQQLCGLESSTLTFVATLVVNEQEKVGTINVLRDVALGLIRKPH